MNAVDMLQTVVATTAFVVGFASVRAHLQRDRAVGRHDTVMDLLISDARSGHHVNLSELRAATRPATEGLRADPVQLFSLVVMLLFLTAATAIATDGAGIGALIEPDREEALLWAIEVVLVGLGLLDWFVLRRGLRRVHDRSFLVQAAQVTSMALSSSGSDDAAAEVRERAATLGAEYVALPWAHAIHGHALLALDTDEDRRVGIGRLRRAVAQSDAASVFLIELGRAYNAIGDWPAAVETFDALRDGVPGEVGAQVNRGDALIMLGQGTRAAADFEAALAAGPVRPARVALRAALARLLTGDGQQAADHVRSAYRSVMRAGHTTGAGYGRATPFARTSERQARGSVPRLKVWAHGRTPVRVFCDSLLSDRVDLERPQDAVERMRDWLTDQAPSGSA